MKRLILALVGLVMATVSQAITYKIIMLNTPEISIGGNKLKLNDTFDGSGDVAWVSPRQAMKVLDVDNGTQRLIVAEQFRKSNVATIKDFLNKRNHLSTRYGQLDNAPDLRNYLSDTFYLVDSLTFNTKMPTDGKRFFYVSFPYKGEEINKRVPCDNGSFTISRDLFSVDGVALTPFDTNLTVYYLDTEEGRLTLITDKLYLCVLPEELPEDETQH